MEEARPPSIGGRFGLVTGKIPETSGQISGTERQTVKVDHFRIADHLDTIARGGGWSFRTWCYSGKSRLPIWRPLDEDTYTASASLLLAAATKSIVLTKYHTRYNLDT